MAFPFRPGASIAAFVTFLQSLEFTVELHEPALTKEGVGASQCFAYKVVDARKGCPRLVYAYIELELPNDMIPGPLLISYLSKLELDPEISIPPLDKSEDEEQDS